MPESPASTPKLVILISGSGTNLQAFIDAVDSTALNAQISGVISNRAGAKGMERAASVGIPTQIIDHKVFASREAFDDQLTIAIDNYSADLVILAGFMRILTPGFVNRYAGRLMNIHPSLLPQYPGLNTHQRAIDAGDNQAGATVHFVTSELDGGPPIIQAQVAIKPNDTAEALAQRVLTQEHLIYPVAADWFCRGKLQLDENNVLLEGEKLPANGYQFSEQ